MPSGVYPRTKKTAKPKSNEVKLPALVYTSAKALQKAVLRRVAAHCELGAVEEQSLALCKLLLGESDAE